MNYDLIKTGLTVLIKRAIRELPLPQKSEWETYFADTAKSATTIAQEITTTDHEINQMVYELYQLSPAEIKIIAGR